MKIKKLPKTVLGRTGLEVTRLGYGAAHRKPQSEENARAVHKAVLEAGINFIDTADDYGNSEELIGQFLEKRRSEYYIATKCGGSPTGHIWTKEHCLKTFKDSLQRLRTDVIDVMQLHNPTVVQSQAGHLVEALQEMKQTGKVRWIGVSTTLPDLAIYLDWGVFDTYQIPYSALERDHEDWISKAAQEGAGIIIRGGAALGEPGYGTGDDDGWKNFEKAELDELREPDESRTCFVLRFTLSHPQAHTVIVGTTNLGHLHENIEAVCRGPLKENTYLEAKRRLDCIGISPKPTD